MSLPPKLQEIVDDFASMSREEKIETLIGYAESLPPLPERFKEERAKMDPIPECMTPVFLFGEKQADGGVIFHFDIPPQSPTVQGLACILATGLNGCKPEEILGSARGLFRSDEIGGSHLRSTAQRFSRRAGAYETNRSQLIR